MKRTIFTLLLFTTTCSLFAQPVIQYGNKPSIGYKAFAYSFQNANLTPGASGANQTWDLTSDSTFLTPFDSTIYLIVDSAALTPYASKFPTGNFCTAFHQGANTFYNYEVISPTSFGDTADDVSADSATDLIYSGAIDPELEFPFNFQETWITTGDVNATGTVVADTIVYDAYGTLITSVGTFNNVVRTRSTNGGYTKYEWWSSNPIFPILIISPDDTSFFVPANITTGISNVAGAIHGLTVSPNPSSGSPELFFNMEKTSTVDISLYDISGRLMKQLFNETLSAGNNSMKVDDSGLASGMYFITVHAGTISENVKYVKL